MKQSTAHSSWFMSAEGAGYRRSAQATTILLLVCLLAGLSAKAQRDIFNWQLSGHAGLIGSRAVLDIPDEDSRFTSGLRLNRNLGRAWQLGLHASQLDFMDGDQGLTFSGLSFTYNWDNGALLKQRAFISPFHTLDLGYMARADYREWVTYEESYAYNFENGLKFRLGDRVTAQVSYAVYWQVDEADVSNSFDQTFLKVWKVGINYHFGARKVSYKGPTFDASARYDRADQGSFEPIRPIVELPDMLRPVLDTAQVMRPAAAAERISQAETRVDTTYLYRVDTVYAIQRDTVYVDSMTFSKFSTAETEARYKAMNDRMLYLEGFMQGRLVSDSLGSYGQTAPRSTDAADPREIIVKQEEYGNQRSSARSAQPEPSSARSAPTDPALLEILKRQEEQIANQTLLLRQMQENQSQTTQPRNRMRTQVSPTVMVPLNNPQNSRSEERIAVLEEQIKQLEIQLAAQTALPTSIQQQTEEAQTARDTVVIPLPIATDPSPRSPIVGLTAAELQKSTEEIQMRIDSIDAANAQRQASRDTVSAQTAPGSATVAGESSSSRTSASYPVVFLFGLNKAEVDDSYQAEFDKIASDLKGDASRRALITGFTDRSGNVDYNKQLSKRRADSVREQLLSRGVRPSQVRITGQGQENASRAWNPSDRRVEVVLE